MGESNRSPADDLATRARDRRVGYLSEVSRTLFANTLLEEAVEEIDSTIHCKHQRSMRVMSSDSVFTCRW